MPFSFHIYCKLTFLAKTAGLKLNKSLNEPAHKILVLIELAAIKSSDEPQELEVSSLYYLYSLKTKSSQCHYVMTL